MPRWREMLDIYLRTFVSVDSDKSFSLDSLKKLTAKCMNRRREENLQASEILFFKPCPL